jgi:hypothetical protein
MKLNIKIGAAVEIIGTGVALEIGEYFILLKFENL